VNNQALLSFWKSLGLPSKFQYIKDKYGTDLIPPSEKYMLSINKVRNCLVHREGKVSRNDVNEDNELDLLYDTFRVFAKSPEGEKRFLDKSPFKGPRGWGISMGRYEKVKKFKLMETVVLTEEEYMEICMSLYFFCVDLLECLNTHCRSTGLVKDEIPNEESEESV